MQIRIQFLHQKIDFVFFETDDAALANERDLASRDRVRSQQHNVIEIPDGKKSVFVFLPCAMDLV